MTTMFLVCAAVGGTLLLLQFLAGWIGFGGDDGDGGHGDGGHDAGGDHHFDAHDTHDGHADAHDQPHGGVSNWLFGVLSFKSIMTAITFFGLGGMSASTNGLDDWQSLGVALLCGVVALYAVAWLMKFLYGLKADGTVRLDRAVGKTGTVYLKIPGRRAGPGKVTLTLQNRSVEYVAVTEGGDLPTGSKVVVVAVHKPDTLEVALAPLTTETQSSGSPTHV